MENEESVVEQPVKQKPHLFQPGQAKPAGSGRKKKSSLWAARAICDEAGVNPIRVALEIVMKGKLPAIPGRVSQVLSDAERLKVLLELIPFLMPKLSAQSITGADNGPIAVATLDVTKLLENPELAAAAQQIALLMSGTDLDNEAGEAQAERWKRIDGPKQRLLES